MRAVREEAKQARQAARDLKKQLDALTAANTQRDEETKARNLALAKALGLRDGRASGPGPAGEGSRRSTGASHR